MVLETRNFVFPIRIPISLLGSRISGGRIPLASLRKEQLVALPDCVGGVKKFKARRLECLNADQAPGQLSFESGRRNFRLSVADGSIKVRTQPGVVQATLSLTTDQGLNLPKDLYDNLLHKQAVFALKWEAEAERDVGQCAGFNGGYVYARIGEWTPKIRLDTDGRPGGCLQSWAVLDPGTQLDGLDLRVNWRPGPKADAGQCGAPGERQIKVSSTIPGTEDAIGFTPPIRVDTDGRNGYCEQVFSLNGTDKYVLDVRFEPDWDSASNGQCLIDGKPIAAAVETTLGRGQTLTLGLDMDDRLGGCVQSFRLREK